MGCTKNTENKGGTIKQPNNQTNKQTIKQAFDYSLHVVGEFLLVIIFNASFPVFPPTHLCIMILE